MELKIKVPYKKGQAYYRVLPEYNKIYNAYLLNFMGINDDEPPQRIVLIKGYRHWSGNIEDEELLCLLGAAIDNEVENNRKPA